jgi:hypothetical protein
VAHIFVGPGASPRLTHDTYIRRLTNKYNIYIHRLIDKFSNFLLLSVLAVSLDEEPLKQTLFITIPAYPAQFNKIQLNSRQFNIK